MRAGDGSAYLQLFLEGVVAFGIASNISQDVDEFYVTTEEAEAAFAQILWDEPEFEGRFGFSVSRGQRPPSCQSQGIARSSRGDRRAR